MICPVAISVEDRFWAKVQKSDGCWLWTAATNGHGYGRFGYAGRRHVYAHRYAYELAHGGIPSGMELDHLCHTPSCVRPDHLEPVAHRENVLRGASPSARQARQTHCHNGHELFGPNLFVDTNGRRQCRICTRNRLRARRAKARSAK